MFFQKPAVRAIALTLVLVMAGLAFAGCSATNPNATVLLVGDIKVGLTKYYSLYNSYKNFYSNYGLYDVSTAEKLKNFQDIIFDYLVESYLPLYWANQNGVTLDEQEEAQVQADYEEQLEGYLTSYASDVDESITDEAAIRAAELKLFKKELRSQGWTYKEYTTMLMDNIRAGYIATKFMDSYYAERVNVTDADVEANYNELLAKQQADYATTPAQYLTDYNSYISSEGQQPLVAPEGYRFVKHILIKFAADGEEKDVDAIVAQVQEKINAGSPFDMLVEEYGEDPGMKEDPYKTSGYLISNETIDQYYDNFGDAAMALKAVGDISAPVETEAGYHFILYASDVDTAPLAYDTVKDAMKESAITEAKSAIYSELLEQWKADTKIVKYYTRVSNIR